ncbi:hypothetical protein DFQ29_009896 [Apophysomyces sp. BC1021]|nr:hypothetical protein DFQ29_009896 [Apophysomyces sp. BC1021]
MGQTQSSHPSKRKRSDTQASEHGHQHITPFVYKEQKSVHSSGKPTIPQFDERRCEEWYMRYADPDTPDYILPEGTQQFFEDMNVSMEDVSLYKNERWIAVVAIAWKMNMATMGYITKNEWMSSMRKFGTDSMEKLKRKRAELEKSVHDPEQLKEMYNYTFGYAKNKEQKCMDVDVAIVLWNLILADKYPVVFEFVRFLQVGKSERKEAKLMLLRKNNRFALLIETSGEAFMNLSQQSQAIYPIMMRLLHFKDTNKDA